MDLSTLITLMGTLLLHSVWQGALIGLLYALTMLALGGSSPRARYNAALLHLALFALAPVLTGLWLLPPGETAAAVGAIAASLGLPGGPALDWQSVAPWLTAGWLAGVLALGSRLAWHWRRTARLTCVGCQPLPAVWTGRLTELAARMGVGRPVGIVESAVVSVPTVVGWLKPVILIPGSALLGLSRRQLELVIAHELAHIRRYDYVANCFLLLTETLFFYHPVVYLIGRGMRQERELCCDDLVVARCGRRVEYATALTDLETLRSGHALSEPLSNLAATGGDLLHRVQRLLRGSAPAVRRLHLVTAASALTVLFGLTALFGEQRGAPEVGVAELPSPPRVQPQWRATSVAPAAFASEAIDVPSLARSMRRAPTDVEAVAAKAAAYAASARTERQAPVPKLTVPVTVSASADAPGAARSVAADGDRTGGGAASRLEIPAAGPAGPTHAMMTELDLAPPLLETVSDLQRDASRALTVAKSPYVIVGADNVESDYVVSEHVREEGGALIKRIEPRYPSRARLRGYTDTVQIEFRVTGTGRVEDIVVVSASRPSFERAVVRAVKKWRYEPLLRDGVPVERTMVETFAFEPGAQPTTNHGTGCRIDRSDNTFSCSSPGINRVL